MSYSIRSEVREMLKEDALNAIIGDSYEDDESRETNIGPIIDAAIADADGEIDGYLAKRYPVPVSPAPKVLNKLSKDIAIYNLYSRQGIDEGDGESNYRKRYEDAIKFLSMVAAGKADIATEEDSQASAAKTGFSVQSNRRLFTRNSMRGM